MSQIELPKHKACLFVIIDDINEDYNYYSFLLNYFNKKLKDLDIFLSRTFFISRLDHEDLVGQLRYLLDEYENKTSLDWIFLTTTNQRNDSLMLNLIDQLKVDQNSNTQIEIYYKNELGTLNGTRSEKEHLIVYKKFLFLINNQFFFKNLSILFNFLTIQNEPSLNNKSKFLEKTNYINADYLVYDFEHLSASYNQNDGDKSLQFLLNKFNLNNFYSKLKHSINVIEQCLLKSNSKQTCISFNGGKDCCVVLYLYFAVAVRLGYAFPLNVVIINIKNSFEEMDNFIEKEIKSFYKNSLEFIVFEDTSKSLKQCLGELKEIRSHIDSILMGTRRSDSAYFKNMSEFAPTDADWPAYMRVNPILDWTYSEIWYFIRLLKLPYCTLYDRGYTSLDSSVNTVPNKALLNPDGTYSPAFMLVNEELERESRKKYAKI